MPVPSWLEERTRLNPPADTGDRAGSLVEDLHAEGLLILVLVVIDVNQDLLLTRALAGGEAQADGVHLATGDLRDTGTCITPGTARPGWVRAGVWQGGDVPQRSPP